MKNKQRDEVDSKIKDYIAKIRYKRDYMYKDGLLPINALIETTTYKPVL